MDPMGLRVTIIRMHFFTLARTKELLSVTFCDTIRKSKCDVIERDGVWMDSRVC